MGERFPDTEEAVGSIPSAPTRGPWLNTKTDETIDEIAVDDAGRFLMMAGPAVLHKRGVRYPAEQENGPSLSGDE